MENYVEDQLINFKVFLWGINPINKNLLLKYDTGNRNPVSIARIKKNKILERGDKYDDKYPYKKSDLNFLNSEYDLITHLISESDITENIYILDDLQEKIYNKIEEVEKMKDNIDKPKVRMLKGSKEAFERAEKMRNSKTIKPVIQRAKAPGKARFEKGSEEAKELSRKLVEAKRAKKQAIIDLEKANEDKKIWKKDKLKPWFYIGDIPKGYRVATEDEAIFHLKVSEFGKNIVDKNKFLLFRDHRILLSDKKTKWEKEIYIKGLSRRYNDCKYNITVFKSKLENDKYESRKDEFLDKLDNEIKKKKYLKHGLKFYLNLL
jgi:hypothetical protein